MTSQGPDIERLTRRLAECPPEFLAPPRVGAKGGVHTSAVVHDLILDLGGPAPDSASLAPFQPATATPRQANHLRLTLVAAWLLHDGFFREPQSHGHAALAWLTNHLPHLAALVKADLFVTDPGRREELVRLCLAALSITPRGETKIQAQDKLKSLSSLERHRVIQAAKAQQEKAKKIREAMERKRAREAASKVMHE